MTAKVAESAAVAAHLDGQMSSLFDIPTGKPTHVGSSFVSLACGPSLELDGFHPKPQVEYENSYRMDPPKRFIAEKVQPIIEEALEAHIGKIKYDPIMCALLCKTIAQDIKLRVKATDLPRFKLICLVNIGEKRCQDVRYGSRCLWDAQRDSFASGFYENPHLFSTGTVYAIYYE